MFTSLNTIIILKPHTKASVLFNFMTRLTCQKRLIKLCKILRPTAPLMNSCSIQHHVPTYCRSSSRLHWVSNNNFSIIMRFTLEKRAASVAIGRMKISNLSYADDITLFATSIFIAYAVKWESVSNLVNGWKLRLWLSTVPTIIPRISHA